MFTYYKEINENKICNIKNLESKIRYEGNDTKAKFSI